MIYTVTFNPSLDYIVTVPHFTCGMVNRTSEEKIFPGGKGINVSMVLKNLGLENTALGFYAGFTGNELERLIREKGIRADFIPVKEGMTRINVKMRSDEESEINGQGPAISEADIKTLYEKLDRLSDGDVLVMAGSIPDVMPQTIYMDIMKYLADKDLKIVVDATKDLLVNVLQYHPFLIKPNNHELGEIFGVKITEKEDGSGIGIKNVKEVLKMMYQQDHLLYFENLEPEGTKITIWIPKTLKCTDEEKDEER